VAAVRLHSIMCLNACSSICVLSISMFVYNYVHVCLSIMCVFVHVCLSIRVFGYMYVCLYACLYITMCVCL